MSEKKFEDTDIVRFGRREVKRYDSQEFRDPLIKAFSGRGPDATIVLDSNPFARRFQAAAAAWAIDHGFLRISNVVEGDQEIITEFMLTEKGQKEFLSK